MKEVPLECEVSHELNGVHSWTTKFVGPYLGHTETSSMVYFMNTSHEDSEVNVHNALSFEKSCYPFKKPDDVLTDEHDDQYICDEQCSPQTYFDGSTITRFYNQESVIHIPVDQFTPHHLYVTKFPHIKSLRTVLLKGENKERNLIEARMRLNQTIYYLRYPLLKPKELQRNLNEDDDFILLKKHVEEIKEGWVKNNVAAKRKKAWIRANMCVEKDNHILDSFNYIWNPSGNINDVMKNLVTWEQTNTNKIKKFVLPEPTDATKTPFLNMTAMMMKTYEDNGVIHMHSHLHLMFSQPIFRGCSA
jgi:hypothetical protein